MSDDEWIGDPVYLDTLRRSGTLAEIQALWDAEDRGENPYDEPITYRQLRRRVRRIQRRAFWRGVGSTFNPFGR